jgi:hypothetical protein
MAKINLKSHLFDKLKKKKNVVMARVKKKTYVEKYFYYN